MLTYPLSRRQWLGFSALGCGCVLGSSAAFSEAASTLVPVGYTPPEPVTDLAKAPRLQAKLTAGAEGQVRSYAMIFGKGDEIIMSGMTAFAGVSDDSIEPIETFR